MCIQFNCTSACTAQPGLYNLSWNFRDKIFNKHMTFSKYELSCDIILLQDLVPKISHNFPSLSLLLGNLNCLSLQKSLLTLRAVTRFPISMYFKETNPNYILTILWNWGLLFHSLVLTLTFARKESQERKVMRLKMSPKALISVFQISLFHTSLKIP